MSSAGSTPEAHAHATLLQEAHICSCRLSFGVGAASLRPAVDGDEDAQALLLMKGDGSKGDALTLPPFLL